MHINGRERERERDVTAPVSNCSTSWTEAFHNEVQTARPGDISMGTLSH